jgi:hypothetical protein
MMHTARHFLKFKIATLATAVILTTSAIADEKEPENRVDESERVTVTWVNPKEFTDVKPTNGISSRFRNHTMESLYEYVDKLAQDLPQGQKLKLNVTDLDLAGRVWPGHIAGFDTSSDVRLVKDIEIPRMNFSYELVDSSGSVVKSGEIKLKDMSFMSRSNLIRKSDSLKYEKNMFRQWFNKEFKDELTSNEL